jgi:hypothetical protein
MTLTCHKSRFVYVQPIRVHFWGAAFKQWFETADDRLRRQSFYERCFVLFGPLPPLPPPARPDHFEPIKLIPK